MEGSRGRRKDAYSPHTPKDPNKCFNFFDLLNSEGTTIFTLTKVNPGGRPSSQKSMHCAFLDICASRA